MSVLPIQALAGLGLLQAANGLPAVVVRQSADFAGLLRSTLGGDSDGSPESGPAATNCSTATLPAPGTVDADGLRSQVNTLTKTFKARLDQILSEKGLDTFPGLHLRLDAAGNIRVDGDHPQKAAIEAAIAAHPELADVFRALSANLKLLQAIESPQEKPGSERPSTVDLYVDANGVEASLVHD